MDADIASLAADAPEQRFLEYARTNDKAIIQGLIREYADRSFNQARKIIGRADGAEDAVQEAYMRLVKTADRYDGSVPFVAWLSRLVTSAAINQRRELSRRSRLSDASDQGIAAMRDHGTAVEQADPPVVEALRNALDSLPQHYRTPLTLYYFSGLNQSETAQALGISATTIAKQLTRGIDQLREKLARAGFAVSSASLIAAIAGMPAQAASTEFTHALTTSSGALIPYRRFSTSVSGVQAGAVATLVLAAAITASMLDSSAPISPRALSAQPVPGLIAHWTFDEGEGEIAIDLSGNGNNGALINSPGRVPGKFGGALSFDGVSSYVSVPSSPSLNSIIGEMTAAAWILKRESTQGSNWASILGRRTGSEYDDLWRLAYHVDKNDAYFFNIILSGNEELLPEIRGSTSLSDVNIWTHVACVFDGAELRLYRNGARIGSTSGVGYFAVETTPVTIGASELGEYPAAEFLNGTVDEVRLYNRALSDLEIAGLAH